MKHASTRRFHCCRAVMRPVFFSFATTRKERKLKYKIIVKMFIKTTQQVLVLAAVVEGESCSSPQLTDPRPGRDCCIDCDAATQQVVAVDGSPASGFADTNLCCPKVENAAKYNTNTCEVEECDDVATNVRDPVGNTCEPCNGQLVSSTGEPSSATPAITDVCCELVTGAATYDPATCKATTCLSATEFVNPAINTCTACTDTALEQLVTDQGAPITATTGPTDLCCPKVEDAATYDTATCKAATCADNHFRDPVGNTCDITLAVGRQLVSSSGELSSSTDVTDVSCGIVLSAAKYDPATCEVTACNSDCGKPVLTDDAKCVGCETGKSVASRTECGGTTSRCCPTIEGAASYNFIDCNATACMGEGTKPVLTDDGECVGCEEDNESVASKTEGSVTTSKCCATIKGATSYNFSDCKATACLEIEIDGAKLVLTDDGECVVAKTSSSSESLSCGGLVVMTMTMAVITTLWL